MKKGTKPMNAIQFIQLHGVEKAREVVEGAPDGSTKFNTKTGQYLKTIRVATIGYPSSGMVVQACIKGLSEAYSIELSDLKRLVESVDLIKFYSGIENANLLLAMGTCLADRPPHAREVQLKQAIADYEAIGGEHV